MSCVSESARCPAVGFAFGVTNSTTRRDAPKRRQSEDLPDTVTWGESQWRVEDFDGEFVHLVRLRGHPEWFRQRGDSLLLDVALLD
mgnify:CR=1 FL=1